MAQPTENQQSLFSVVTRCVVFVGRPRHSQQFDVVPISPGHDAKATDHQEGHDVHATPFQLNLESCEHFFTVQKKTTSNSKQNPLQEQSSAMAFASDMIFAKFSNHLKRSMQVYIQYLYSICCKLAHFNLLHLTLASPYCCCSTCVVCESF